MTPKVPSRNEEKKQTVKNNLEKQIQGKKQELIHTTASVIKKNETIISLRNELNRLKDLSPNKQRTNKLLSSSKNDLKSNNDWSQFETIFKEVKADFFENLSKKYPSITTRDLRLCAYILTGLSSKEISPLMGISKRGVDLHRYRLRKKMGLDKNESFTSFLKKF